MASPETEGELLSMFPSNPSDASRNAHQGDLLAFIYPQENTKADI